MTIYSDVEPIAIPIMKTPEELANEEIRAINGYSFIQRYLDT